MARKGLSPRQLPKLLLALAIGTLGGAAASWLALPLPWMIGAMTATTAAAVAGAPIVLPQGLRSVMVAVLGVMLGSGFAAPLASRLGYPASPAEVRVLLIAGGPHSEMPSSTMATPSTASATAGLRSGSGAVSRCQPS